VVYFIEAIGVDLLKIGHTDRDVETRLRELQTGNPHTLRIAAMMQGDTATERSLHEQYKHLRVNGEWFKVDAELRVLIVALRWVQPQVSHLLSEIHEQDGEIVAVREHVNWLHRQLFPDPEHRNEDGTTISAVTDLEQSLDATDAHVFDTLRRVATIEDSIEALNADREAWQKAHNSVAAGMKRLQSEVFGWNGCESARSRSADCRM
jgi:hypothetical protein